MSSHASVSRKTLVVSWVALVLLSVITVMAGQFDHRLLPGMIVLLAGLAKAWLIVDHFMELRHAHQGWRMAMLGWPLVMALAIGLAFFWRLGAR